MIFCATPGINQATELTRGLWSRFMSKFGWSAHQLRRNNKSSAISVDDFGGIKGFAVINRVTGEVQRRKHEQEVNLHPEARATASTAVVFYYSSARSFPYQLGYHFHFRSSSPVIFGCYEVADGHLCCRISLTGCRLADCSSVAASC